MESHWIYFLPCPFCGSKHITTVEDIMDNGPRFDPTFLGFHIVCVNCAAEIHLTGSDRDTVMKEVFFRWNRRAGEEKTE